MYNTQNVRDFLYGCKIALPAKKNSAVVDDHIKLFRYQFSELGYIRNHAIYGINRYNTNRINMGHLILLVSTFN